ncbi:MAG: ribonuclease Z, partial [Bacteroidota bacterium]
MNQAVRTPEGRLIDPKEVTIALPGRKLVYLGDSYDASSMLPLAENADLLVHEATFLAEKVSESAAREKHHSTAAMAGRFAKEAKVQCLFLNHFSGGAMDRSARDTVLAVQREAFEAMGGD